MDLQPIHSIFKEHIQDINRPESGDIDLLIGYEYAAFHPVPEKSQNHLMLLRNRFGYVIAGTHILIQESTKNLLNMHEYVMPLVCDFVNIVE